MTVPELSWQPQLEQQHVHVVVLADDGSVAWTSGQIASTNAAILADIAPRSRARYMWRVRVSYDGRSWTEWSELGAFEYALLENEDWSAEWIARPVPEAQRTSRALVRGRLDWAEAGMELAQTFTATGDVTAVHVDLTGTLHTDVGGRVDVVSADGTIVGTREIRGQQYIWERFMHFVEIDPPTPAGEYTVKLTVTEGRIGWYAGDALAPAHDDGVRPLLLHGAATQDGHPAAGIRAVAVETAPAPNPMFRHEFEVGETRERARLYAVALGHGEFRLNGVAVGDGVLDPAPTNFDTRVLYRVWDVASLLRPGLNTLEVEAGRGTFAARGANVWGWNLAPWHAEPMVLAQLEWLDTEGERQRVLSADEWETTPGSTILDLLYCGEVSVSRPAQPWEPATVVEGPSGALTAAQLPPIRRISSTAPSGVLSTAPNRQLYDFTTMITGRVRCTISGNPGDRVIIRYGEALTSDDRVISDNDLAAGLMQIDEHRFDVAAGPFEWEPKFGYRGFRWVEVETHGSATADEPLAFLLYTDVEPAGEFSTDEPLLQWVDSALRRTFLNNLQGIPTDTPIFEKNGWTADAMLATEAVLQQVDLRSSFGKWVQDHADSQDDEGVIPQIVPSPGFALPADPAWSGSCVVIPWQLYWEYGDLRILQNAQGMIHRYADALLAIADGTIWPLRSWGDWLPPGHMLPPEGTSPAATIMMASVLQHAALVMTALGNADLASKYDAAAQRTADAYHEAYFDPEVGYYSVKGAPYRQSLNVLPLAFGTVPANQRESVARSLITDLEVRADGHLDTGAVGSRFLLPVLSAIGRDDLAVTVATQRTRPGWGVWFEAGETTLMESWDEDARSRNHYFLGAAMNWVHQRVGGVRPTAPGWAELEVAPVDDPRIQRGALRHRTPRGEVAIQWRREKGNRLVELVIPGGCIATVPALHLAPLGPGRHELVLPPDPLR